MIKDIYLERLPKDFMWGVATASHQIEGNTLNNWTQWEKDTANERAKKLPSWYKLPKALEQLAHNPELRVSGKACGSLELWKKDIEIMKELNLNSYRFSIEWSRVMPRKDFFDKEAVDYYRSLIKELKKNGIEPMVTCWHWTIPVWLAEEGGILSKNFVKQFSKYVQYIVENLAEDVKYWITINEPDAVSTMSYLLGTFPPQERSLIKYFKSHFVVMVNAHRKAYEIIKSNDKDSYVSIAKNFILFKPSKSSFVNKIVSGIADFFHNTLMMNRISKYLDYIGVNYYFDWEIGVHGISVGKGKLTDFGFPMKPYSMKRVLKNLKKYKLPIIITESGVPDYQDKYRSFWIEENIKAIADAIKSGMDVRGYMHWSLLDNFEWAEGYWPEFGLVDVNWKTLERKIKSSGYSYANIINAFNKFVKKN